LQTPLPFSAIANTIAVLGDCKHHCRSRRLQTPLAFSAIANTIGVLGDCKHPCRSAFRDAAEYKPSTAAIILRFG
jgi:hypothetical protein